VLIPFTPQVSGGAAPHAHRRPASWRSLGRPALLNGQLTTVDNTRVLAAGLTETPVQARVHGFDEPIDPSRAPALQSRKGDVPTTWGEGVTNRIQNQNALYRARYPAGSPFVGWNGS
jgi:hypothetical protein